MSVQMQYYKPYKGWSNEITYLIFSESCAVSGFVEEYAKSRELLARPRDLLMFCKKQLAKRFLLPDTVWGGASEKVDWDQLCAKWDDLSEGKMFRRKTKQVRVRRSTAEKYVEERILGFSAHAGKIYSTSMNSPSADFRDSYVIGSCFGIDVVYWCPFFRLAAVRAEDALHSAGFLLSSAALKRFSSENDVYPAKGTPVDRVCVSQETEEGITEGRVSNFLQVFLDDGSFASRTYFAKKECDDVYELCINSPATVAQELSI